MKTKLKLSAILLAACSNITAHEPLINNNSVTTSNPDYSYDLNFTTSFLKPSTNSSYSSQAYPFNDAYSVPAVSPNWEIYRIKPHYNFAFDLGAQITLHDKASALMGNWEHFLSSDSAAHNVAQSGNMVGPFFSIGPDENSYKLSTGSLTYQKDKFNLTYGQHVEVGQNLRMNLFAGISFSRLKQAMTQFFASADLSITRTIETSNSLSAVGPEIGCDLGYNIHKGLNFMVHLSADLLTGTSKNHTHFASTLTPPTSPSPNQQDITSDNVLLVVPAFSEKIGINYEYNFKDHNTAVIEIGYQTQIYVNAFHTTAFATGVSTPPDSQSPDSGVFAQTWQENITSFALSGPYFKIDIAF